MTKALFVRVTRNSKTGPIPVTYTENTSCPDACPLKKNGCYAESGPTFMAWKRAAANGSDWDTLCDEISRLPRHQRWRHNVAGDLPGIGDTIDAAALDQLAQANKKAKAEGWTYTHKPVLGTSETALANKEAVRSANAAGFRINLSADDLVEADALKALNIGPVVVTLPSDAPNMQKTPAGHTVITCPAEADKIDCARCGICQKERAAIVGFRAHGNQAKKVNERLRLTVVA